MDSYLRTTRESITTTTEGLGGGQSIKYDPELQPANEIFSFCARNGGTTTNKHQDDKKTLQNSGRQGTTTHDYNCVAFPSSCSSQISSISRFTFIRMQ